MKIKHTKICGTKVKILSRNLYLQILIPEKAGEHYGSTPGIDRHAQCNPHQHPRWFLCRKWQADLKICMQLQGNPKQSWKNIVGVLIRQDFKTFYKPQSSRQRGTGKDRHFD